MIAVEDDSPGIEQITKIDLASTSGIIFVCLMIALLVYTAIMAWLFTRTILKTNDFPAPHALTTALTLLTFVALTAAIATNSAALETIAATGMGAIAGALSHVFTGKKGYEAREEVPTESCEEVGEDVPRSTDPEE